jgi:hypothetical protein
MILWADANLQPLPQSGQFLRDFDFEAHDGQGEIDTTTDIALAKRFDDVAAALAFAHRSPACRPTRPDGRPNRPLTATTWQFRSVE